MKHCAHPKQMRKNYPRLGRSLDLQWCRVCGAYRLVGKSAIDSLWVLPSLMEQGALDVEKKPAPANNGAEHLLVQELAFALKFLSDQIKKIDGEFVAYAERTGAHERALMTAIKAVEDAL